MGGAVSSGEDNEELVDKLMADDYLNDPCVEKVFRAVDRGNYFLPDQRIHAYKDQAWKHGNIHLSAPCIYAKVMEWLKLGPGMSFLNLGSGTGYLSTMAGLFLGPYGVNHGVEYYQDVIDFADEKLEEFIRTNEVFDEFEFCEPQFVRGNCLLLSPSNQLYDRIYCGASCTSEYEKFIKNLMKIGGILVVPLNDQLVQVTRVSETEWKKEDILSVSFAHLIPTNSVRMEAEYRSEYIGIGEDERVCNRMRSKTSPALTDLVELPIPKVMTLQEVSRVTIRRILLQNIRSEHPNMSRKRQRKSKKRQPPAKQRRVNFIPPQTGRMFVGQLSDDSDRETEHPERWMTRSRNVRRNTWIRDLHNAYVTRLANPYQVFPPGLDTDQMDAESRMEGMASVEERNADVENGVAEDASLREMQDEAMPDVKANSSESSESSGDEDNFQGYDQFRLQAALTEVTLGVNSDVIEGYERGYLIGTTLGEEAVAMPTVSVAAVSSATVPIVITSTATAHLTTVDIATTSTATAYVGRSMATAGMESASAATADLATLSMATSDLATASTATADEATASTATVLGKAGRAASYSSEVETCSSVSGDSVDYSADAENPSSIFWTQEFQASKAEMENGVPFGKELETCNDGTSATQDHPSPTPREERADQNARDIFGMTRSGCDSTEKPIGKNAEEADEEEAMEAETSEAGATYRTHLQKKVDLLPIPQPMKNFLLFYRN